MLKSIERRAIRGADSHKLSNLIEQLAEGYTTSTTNLNARQVYRTRKNIDVNLFSHVSELTYPNAAIAGLGRANLPGNPVFYCSNSDVCALWEQRPKVGEKFTVSQWGAKQIRTGPKCFIVGELTHKHTHNRPILGKGSMITPEAILKFAGKHRYRKSLLIDEHFSRWFKFEGEKYYNITNAITNLFMSSGSVDGLVYGSIASVEGFNLALKPGSLDVFFKLNAAYVCRIDSIDPELGLPITKIEAIASKINSDGSINWVNSTTVPSDFKSYLIKKD